MEVPNQLLKSSTRWHTVWKEDVKIGQKGIAPSCNNLWTKLMKSFVPFCCSWVTNIRNSSSRNKYDWFDASPPEETEPAFPLPAVYTWPQEGAPGQCKFTNLLFSWIGSWVCPFRQFLTEVNRVVRKLSFFHSDSFYSIVLEVLNSHTLLLSLMR